MTAPDDQPTGPTDTARPAGITGGDRGEPTIRILTSADGEPVALHDFGGEGPNLLLGHGNGLNAGMWAAVVPHLRHRYHCYGIDLRGHGATGVRRTDYPVSRDRFAGDILACVAEVGEPVFYAGHSLGAASVIWAAFDRPEVFTALWLYEPVLIPHDLPRPDRPNVLIEAARRRRMEFDSVDDAVARFSSKPPFSRCDPIAVRAYVEIGTAAVDGRVRLTCEGENEARVYESSEELDFGRLGTVGVPAVVAAGGSGDEANAIPAQMAPLIAEALGDARLEIHQELSHFGPMEDPVAISASIVDHFGPAER